MKTGQSAEPQGENEDDNREFFHVRFLIQKTPRTPARSSNVPAIVSFLSSRGNVCSGAFTGNWARNITVSGFITDWTAGRVVATDSTGSARRCISARPN